MGGGKHHGFSEEIQVEETILSSEVERIWTRARRRSSCRFSRKILSNHVRTPKSWNEGFAMSYHRDDYPEL